MGEVVTFEGVTTQDIPVDRVLQAAVGNLQSVVVLGYAKDGSEYFAASSGDATETLWLLKRCERQLLANADEGER